MQLEVVVAQLVAEGDVGGLERRAELVLCGVAVLESHGAGGYAIFSSGA